MEAVNQSSDKVMGQLMGLSFYDAQQD